ncbi:glutamate racemase, partial [bacterium]|nr:glutamate racemase [bacterium]
MFSPQSPIGVFDSGLGGLSVLKELALAMPHEEFVYLGDIARLPYGTKSRSVVSKYSISCANFLVRQGVKALVVACNTASALALDSLQKTLQIPVIGVIEPGVKAAIRLSKESQQERVLVLATEGTVKSEAYLREFKNQGFQGKVEQLPCPLLVPLAEEGWFDHSVTREVIQLYLSSLNKTHQGI